MKKYEVELNIKFTVTLDIKAENEAEAKAKAIERVNDAYDLNTLGALHNREDVEIESWVYDLADYGEGEEDDDDE